VFQTFLYFNRLIFDRNTYNIIVVDGVLDRKFGYDFLVLFLFSIKFSLFVRP
jgi:hypothetical protein